MGDNREVRVERLYVKVQNTDKLRKTSAGRHRRLIAEGWRELDRKQEVDHVTVRYERTGYVAWKKRLPKGKQEEVRMERRPRGQGRGGFGGGRGGGPRGGGRGRGPSGPRAGAPTPAQPGTTAPAAPPQTPSSA